MVMASIGKSGDRVAVNWPVTIPYNLSAASTMIVSGPRRHGSTCPCLAMATGASSPAMCSSPSAGACTMVLGTGPANCDLIIVLTTAALRVAATCNALRPREAQFEGGLTTPCSRLGRGVRPTVSWVPAGSQFEGTSLRSLGP